jgi:hypothetical protein
LAFRWIACLADALPIEHYVSYLTTTGLTIDGIEWHNGALTELVLNIQGKLLGADLLARLKQVALPQTLDFEQAKAQARSAPAAIRAGQFGYAVLIAARQTCC